MSRYKRPRDSRPTPPSDPDESRTPPINVQSNRPTTPPFASAEFFISSQHPTPALVDMWNQIEPGIGTAILRLSVEHSERALQLRENALALETKKIDIVERQLVDDNAISIQKLDYLKTQGKRSFQVTLVGQSFAFIICMSTIAGAIWLLSIGRNLEGFAALILALGTPAGVIIVTKVYDVKTSERLSKESAEEDDKAGAPEHEAVDILMGRAK